MLTDCYPPRLGGIESQVRDLSRQLVRAGHEVEVFTATAGPHGERGGHTSTGDDGVTVHRLAIPLPGGIPVNPFAPREVRRRLAAGWLRRRACPPRRREPVRHRPRAGGARRRPARHRHLPLRDRPLVARCSARSVTCRAGPGVASPSTRCRGWRPPGCPPPPAARSSRWCPTAWMPRGGTPGPSARRRAPGIRCTSCRPCGWCRASVRWPRSRCCTGRAPCSTRPCRCARRSSARGRSAA